MLASVAAGIDPPVGPVSRITADPAALAVSTRRLRRLGFFGRACIHPAQIPVVHAVYTPTAGEVEPARAVIALLDRAEAHGSGVVLDAEGRMVDAAVLHAARRTLALAGGPRDAGGHARPHAAAQRLAGPADAGGQRPARA